MGEVSAIIGDKDPFTAEKGTIREKFSDDSLENANNERRIVDNVVHFQEDQKKMQAEVKMFEDLTQKLSPTLLS